MTPSDPRDAPGFPDRGDGGDDRYLPWRVRQLEQWRERLTDIADPVILAKDIQELRSDVRGVKNLLRALVLSIVGACITFGFTVLLVLR